MIRVFEAFAGIGTQRMALKNIGVEHEVVGISEIDKFAIKSYMAIHGETKNFGDISKINIKELPDFDLFTYSFPCQDISVAGEGRGLKQDSGTRSSLLWDCQDIIEAKRPKYLLMENVKNLVGKKHKAQFDKWLDILSDLGYTNYWQVLNAKDYGVPQNRERVFGISIRKDVDNGKFEFPLKTITPKLQPYLLDELEDQYYLTKDEYERIQNTKYRANKRHESKTKQLIDGDVLEFQVMDYRYDEGLRVRANKLCPTLTTRGKQSISGVPIFYENGRLRFITPLECWRLMGIDDKDFFKAQEVNSNTQLYKQAGNAIVVDVLEGIFEKLYMKKECKSGSYN